MLKGDKGVLIQSLLKGALKTLLIPLPCSTSVLPYEHILVHVFFTCQVWDNPVVLLLMYMFVYQFKLVIIATAVI